jgi:hypothetical protein
MVRGYVLCEVLGSHKRIGDFLLTKKQEIVIYRLLSKSLFALSNTKLQSCHCEACPGATGSRQEVVSSIIPVWARERSGCEAKPKQTDEVVARNGIPRLSLRGRRSRPKQSQNRLGTGSAISSRFLAAPSLYSGFQLTGTGSAIRSEGSSRTK